MPLNLFKGLWVVLSLLSAFPANADSGDVFLRQLLPYLSLDGLRGADGIKFDCQSDRYCMARRLLMHIKGPAQIRRIVSPSSDSIRRAKNLPSIERSKLLAPDHLYISLRRFGRNVEDRILALCQGQEPWRRITLDMRGNKGGDPMRMLKVAALFSAPRADVFYAWAPNGDRKYYAIPKIWIRCRYQQLTVLIGGKTASSAEILVSLLKSHAGATLQGVTTYGKNFLYRLIPLNQHWRLYLPAEKIVLPGRDLNAGIAADGPVPAALRKQLE